MPKICQCEGCNRTVFAWLYCLIHQFMRKDEKWLRTQEKKKEKKPVKSIPKQSKTQKIRDTAYGARVKIWKLENPFCCVPDCGNPTDDCHHMISRGIHTNNEKYWKPLCRPHHNRIKVDDKWANEQGLILTKTISRKNEY